MAVPANAEQTAVVKHSSTSVFEGFLGHQLIRTNIATVNGIGYVHTQQMDIGAPAGAFVAIGTAKGFGVPGTNCPDSYNSPWDIFTDGTIGGVYFCRTEANDVYGAGDGADFKIVWGTCPSTSTNQWLMYFGGFRRCLSATASQGSRVVAMLETTALGGTTVDRNIDFTASGMQYRIGGTWIGMNGLAQVIAPSYEITVPQPDTANVFLPPLN
jgi:hypothetical protein